MDICCSSFYGHNSKTFDLLYLQHLAYSILPLTEVLGPELLMNLITLF